MEGPLTTQPLTGVDDLYGLPLDRFVAERRALAKALRAGGQREQAASVAGRRKPSVAAWAVNQLVRTQGPMISSLFDAGDALQRTQSELLAGRGDARGLREAAERERAAVEELAEAARGLLSSRGYELTQATLDRVSATLHTAALDEEAREQVRDGCLERELRRVGFGTAGSVTTTGAGSGRARARTPPKSGERARAKPRTASDKAAATGEPEDRARAQQADRDRVDREQAERARAEKLKAARQAEAGALRSAERAARELEAAQERRDRAATSLRAAEDALVPARERAEEAAREHRRARRSLHALSPRP